MASRSGSTLSALVPLQSCILRPLRRTLGLPNSAHSESVLAEFGICDLQRYWQQMLVAWAARNTRIMVQGPAALEQFPAAAAYHDTAIQRKRVLDQMMADPSMPTPPIVSSLPFRALAVFFEDWKKGQDKIGPAADDDPPPRQLPSFSASILKRIAASLFYSDWRSSGKGSLQQHRFNGCPGLASYLRYDDRQTFCLRARLRFARSYLRSHRHRLGLSDSDTCGECKAGVAETVDHVILSCDKYNEARQQLCDELSRLHLQLSSALVLGAFQKEPDSASAVFAATGTFLRAVHELRQL